LDDWFTVANMNLALARPGHQPTVATGSFLAPWRALVAL
jgi:hypothetical protein